MYIFKENIEDNYAKKTKYESTGQNPGASNSIALCSKSLAENANRSIEETDQEYAEKLQLELNQETDPLSSSSSTARIVSSVPEFLKNLALKVDTTDQFLIVTRRRASLDGRLALRKRESLKSSPSKKLMVHYSGEKGIDDGAIHMKFLTHIMSDIKSTVFPTGTPCDSMLDVHSSNLFACGQIAAVSLVNGGSVLNLFHENIFNLMVTKNNTDLLKSTELEKYFVPNEHECFSQIKANPIEHSDFILENGYTGVINDENVDNILGAIMVSISSRRILYLNEILRGLELFGIKETLLENKTMLASLFINSFDTAVNANYVFSLVEPSFSEEGSFRNSVEEKMFDHLQDFLIMMKDENISCVTESLAYDTDNETSTKESEAKINPAGFLKWATGQNHKPLSIGNFNISVKFNHDCFTKNPLHKYVFQLLLHVQGR